jgi:hypothetical protein
MKNSIVFGIILLILSSCGHKNVNKESSKIEGVYKGQFLRSSPLARYAPANVTITFTGNKFEGESDRENYPEICHGTYNLKDSEIEFTNACMFTAQFDWSLILKDKYQITIDGNKLEMTKTVNDTTDHYTLILQEKN